MSKKKDFFKNRSVVYVRFKEKVNSKKPKQRGYSQGGTEYRKVYLPVRVKDLSGVYGDISNYEWPEFATESKRIREYSLRDKGMTITEAFEKEYGIKTNLSENAANVANMPPMELHVGDVVPMKIGSITKDNVTFDAVNLKQLVSTNANLYRFENFRKFIPKDPIKVKVTQAAPDRIVVDPFTPMIEEWINPIIANPNSQKVLGNPQVVEVKDLKLTNGGLVGKAVIPNISKFVGEDYTIGAFIPGSQIVLNIEDDFTKWEGKTVKAFVTSYHPNSNWQLPLICSVKEYLKFEGEQNLIQIFNAWCDQNEIWNTIKLKNYVGIVTGVICTSKKCGVFVEIPELNITGMVPTPTDQLVNYPPKTAVNVNITSIEEEVYYDYITEQQHHSDPYTIENGCLEKCTIKPVLRFAQKKDS